MEELQTINVGIFGHIDHGKTTLLEKLSGKWTDTHSEEIKRGITIKLGYADTTISKENNNFNIQGKGNSVRHVSFIDCPGHEMLMATTLSGATLIDAAILVVAANEGIKPQTREHLMVLKAKKISRVIVVQNKIDLVTKEQALKNCQEVKKFLGKEYENSPIIPVSALQNVNISAVLKAIAEIPVPDRKSSDIPLFTVARSFDINKPGTKPKDLHGAVLGGTLIKGKLKVGDEIEIKPGKTLKEGNDKKYSPIKTKILSLFKGSKKVQELTPGGSASIETELDMIHGRNDALAGNLVSLSGKLPNPSTNITLKYELFPEVFGLAGHSKVEDIKKGEVLMLSINTSITGGTVLSENRNEITLSLKVPAITFKGDNAGIARNLASHWRLIGFGKVC
jgi:translation initiation factor 2 subunit 3